MNKTGQTKQGISIIGGGSWATALAHVLQENGLYISWYFHEEEHARHMREHGQNPQFLRSVEFDTSQMYVSDKLDKVVGQSELLLFVTPSAYLKAQVDGCREDLGQKKVISAIKGIIPENNQIISRYFFEQHGVKPEHYCVLSGPSHAEEIAQERQTYLTFASANEDYAQAVANLFETNYLHTSLSKDVQGIEYAAVLKNIVAIAAGIAHGLYYGDNFHAALTANAFREIKRFLDTVCPGNGRDINASAYLGDLLVTSYSQFSRNRSFGNMIGKGYSVRNAHLEMNMVSEGYTAVKCLYEINKEYQVDMPVTDAVYRILYENSLARKEMQALTQKFI